MVLEQAVADTNTAYESLRRSFQRRYSDPGDGGYLARMSVAETKANELIVYT